jgi:hypothetical protein
MLTQFSLQERKGRRDLEDREVDGEIVELDLTKIIRRVCIGVIWLNRVASGGLVSTRNEPPGSIKRGYFLAN